MLFRTRQYDAAADRLKEGLPSKAKTAATCSSTCWTRPAPHSAGKYARAPSTFSKLTIWPDQGLHEPLDARRGHLLTCDNIKDYKGEDFENVLIILILR